MQASKQGTERVGVSSNCSMVMAQYFVVIGLLVGCTIAGSLGTTSNPQQQINKGVKDLCVVSKDKTWVIIFEKRVQCFEAVLSRQEIEKRHRNCFINQVQVD